MLKLQKNRTFFLSMSKKEIHNVEINVNNIGEEETEIYQLNICNVEKYLKYTEFVNYP